MVFFPLLSCPVVVNKFGRLQAGEHVGRQTGNEKVVALRVGAEARNSGARS